jgi:RNA polymerase sigma-70 factor (ECF subfamily)
MGVYKLLSDGELVHKLIELDRDAVAEVYLRYSSLLFAHAFKMLRDRDLAKDVVQDIFASLLTSAGNLNFKTPLDSYLYRSVKNQIIDVFRKDRYKEKYISSLKDYIHQSENKTDERIFEREMKLRIESAVASFPPKMREIYEMSRNAHLSRKEIAKEINVSEETVKMQLKRALRILRSKLTLLLMAITLIIIALLTT